MVEKQTGEPKVVPQDYREGMITRIDKSGTTYIPQAMYQDELRLIQRGNRLTCAGLVAGGLGLVTAACAGTVATIDFIRGCGNEQIQRAMVGYPPISTVECFQEGILWIPQMFRHFFSW